MSSHSRDQFGGFVELETTLFVPCGEVGPLDVFGDDVTGEVRRATNIEDGNDAGMVQIGGLRVVIPGWRVAL